MQSPFLEIVTAEPKHALRAIQQWLQFGSCATVIGWPPKVDHHALHRLRVAADTS